MISSINTSEFNINSFYKFADRSSLFIYLFISVDFFIFVQIYFAISFPRKQNIKIAISATEMNSEEKFKSLFIIVCICPYFVL